jgi:redox-sensing transcriptional repressor
MEKVIKRENIEIGIITVPASQSMATAKQLVKSGIKGILNYTPKPVEVPEGVYLEEYDMITTLEKVSFYVKMENERAADQVIQRKDQGTAASDF